MQDEECSMPGAEQYAQRLERLGKETYPCRVSLICAIIISVYCSLNVFRNLIKNREGGKSVKLQVDTLLLVL